MNYRRIYDILIERARGRAVTGYIERHHVIPRCIGGSDNSENIVALTPEEHYVAHQLLVKIHPGKRNLVFALKLMSGNNGRQGTRNNKLYGWHRRRFVEAHRSSQTGRKVIRTPAQKEALRTKLSSIRIGKKRRPHTEENKRKIGNANRGKIRSQEQRRELSEAHKGYRMSEERKINLSSALKGRQKSPEHQAAITKALLGRKMPPLTYEQRMKISESIKRVWERRKAGYPA